MTGRERKRAHFRKRWPIFAVMWWAWNPAQRFIATSSFDWQYLSKRKGSQTK